MSWEFATAPARCAPGIVSMVGYRAFDVPDRVHRGLPSSLLTFIVALDDGVRAAPTVAELPDARPAPVVLGGLHVAASQVRQQPGQAGIQMAVHPLAARALFGLPSAELSVTDFDATAVLGRRVVELRDRLAEAPGWREAFALTARHLIGVHGSRRTPSVRPDLAYAWHLLETSRGRMPVAAVADRVGLSARHLATLFEREVGRTPKTVAMLMRFEYASAAIARAARGPGRLDLAGIAATAGYCDQAHLSRDFVRFTGVPPRVWLAEEFGNIQDGGHSGRSEWSHDWLESDGVHDAPGH